MCVTVDSPTYWSPTGFLANVLSFSLCMSLSVSYDCVCAFCCFLPNFFSFCHIRLVICVLPCASGHVLHVRVCFKCMLVFVPTHVCASLSLCLLPSFVSSFPLRRRLHNVPPPAFVTLLNGDQAQDAIRSLHHSTVRGRLINVTLQPTDSLLCLTNLPHTFTAQQFEELVRLYGNIERSFLVYSELTGHSKGYGFVEYMKKDSASRARSELLGRPLVS